MIHRPTTRDILTLTRGAYDRRMAGAGQFRRGGRGGGRPARKPVTLRPTSASNVLWLRPESAYITADGSNNVSGVTDRGPAGNNASQGTASQQPLWTASSANFNGHPSITHDAVSSEHLRADGVAATASGDDQPVSVIMAVRFTAAPSSNEALFAWGDTGGATNQFRFWRRSDGSWRVQKTGDNATSSAMGGTDARIVSMVYAGSTVTIYDDGAAVTGIDGASLDVDPVALNTFAIGAWVSSVVATPGPIEWADMAVYAGALSDADRQLVESDWAARYGITL